jgi:hypothetical protein
MNREKRLLLGFIYYLSLIMSSKAQKSEQAVLSRRLKPIYGKRAYDVSYIIV